MNDFKTRQVVICVTDMLEPFFTVGGEYTIVDKDGSRLTIRDNNGFASQVTDQYFKCGATSKSEQQRIDSIMGKEKEKALNNRFDHLI